MKRCDIQTSKSSIQIPFRPPFHYRYTIQMPDTMVSGIWRANYLNNKQERSYSDPNVKGLSHGVSNYFLLFAGLLGHFRRGVCDVPHVARDERARPLSGKDKVSQTEKLCVPGSEPGIGGSTRQTLHRATAPWFDENSRGRKPRKQLKCRAVICERNFFLELEKRPKFKVYSARVWAPV